MKSYIQETVLAMELNRSHLGRLVQIITEEWSITGTLSRVDQHDNREWDIDYANGYRLVPRAGEIYATLAVGPWRGDVIGNQPVTVETVKGSLEAPERGPFYESNLRAIKDEMAHTELHGPGRTCRGCEGDAPIEGTVVDPEAVDVAKLEDEVRRGERTINSARAAMGFPKLPAAVTHYPGTPEWVTRCGLSARDRPMADDWSGVTCGICLALKDALDLPPADPEPWARRAWEADLPPAPPEWPDLPDQ